MLKYILAFLVIVGVWVAWFFLAAVIPLWVPILVTVLTVLLLVALILIRVIKARRAANQLEKALAEQAAQHARSARPDVQAEIMEVQAEFEKAIAALKTSKLGKGKNALYALPWQIIIGPPGSGKTTALRNSGLQFPYLSSKTKGGIKGIGGTRNCDWWLTNDAVILDTAGRWATEEEDRDEWLGFLDLVKKFRPRKPLNGIIAAVSVSEIGGATEDEVISLAQKIRERIDEAMNRLQMSLPVYVVFTKCDLVPGFVETFGDLSKSDRGQIWGFTVPMAEKVAPGEYFSTHFDQLVESLEDRQLRRMGDERRIETREMVYIFPKQLEVLKANMAYFVEQLFEENVFQETPAIRGVYFTSGTQEGRPIDRVMHRMAEAFGIQSAIPTSQVTEPKSYFLRDVFRNVIFKDADLAVRSESELRRQRRVRYIFAAAMLLIALLLLTFPVYAWMQNRALLNDTEASLAAQAAAPGTPANQPLPPSAMDRIQKQVNVLDGYDDDGAPVLMRSGLYQGDEVRDPLVDLYANRIRNGVVRVLFEQIQGELNGFVQQYGPLADSVPPSDQYQDNYARLRTYLFLTVPREQGQPAVEDDVQAALAAELAQRWAESLNIPATGATGDAMRRHIDAYLTEMVANSDIAFPRDTNLVIRARGIMNRVPTIALAVQGFIDEFSNRGLDLDLEQLTGGARVPALRAREKVRAAFTRRVWEDHIRDRLESPMDSLTGEPWVLGDTSNRSDTERVQEENRLKVRQQYYEGYINEWHRFLHGIYMMPPNNNQEALELMHALTAGQPTPFQSLMAQTHYNVGIKTVAEEQAEAQRSKAGQDAATKSVEQGVLKKVGKGMLGRAATAAYRANKKTGGAASGPAGLSTELIRSHFEGFSRFGVAPPAPEGQPPAKTTLTAYEEQLSFVRNALQTYMDDTSTGEALLEQIQKARTEVMGMINEQEVGWRPVFKQVLWPPIDGSSFSVSKNMAKGTGLTWCAEVVEPHDETIVGRYPFDRNGHDISFDDFAAYYGPEGIVWTYYNEVLKTSVGQMGDDFEFSRRLGKSTGTVFQPDLLRFLQRSRDITHTFFPPGAEAPVVEFDMRVRPCPEVAIQQVTIGGKMIEYHNGPEEWHRFSWPGEDDPGGGALIEIRGADGMHERIEQQGEWGLFHLIENGTITSGSGRVFTVVWHLRTHDVDISIDIRPVREDSPFFGVAGRSRAPRLLFPVRATHLEPPRDITTGGRIVCRRPPQLAAIDTPRGS